MKFSLNCIRRFLPHLAAGEDELAEVFPRLGFGVESVTPVGLPEDHLVVGRIRSFDPHPNADRLRVCSVDIGGPAPIQIVCGAQNFRPGDLVPVALPNCPMPDGTIIQATSLRGVQSAGMMCSARELGLSEESNGLLILPPEVRVGRPLIEIFPGSDRIFDLELTANRGDCLSHLGISRELAAFYGLDLVQDFLPTGRALSDCRNFTETQRRPPHITVESDDCLGIFLWRVEGLKVGPSPKWLCDDLTALGFRPVNNVVDVTNWIMLQVGQPLHAFDAGKIRGDRLLLRQGKSGEVLEALNHRSYSFDERTLVIADGAGPLAIAGVMGGLRSEVDGSTREILLEAAHFAPESIQRTSRRLNLFSDASQRFARGIDPARVFQSAKDAVDLIVDLAGGRAEEFPRIGRWKGRTPILETASRLDATKASGVYDRAIDLSGDFLQKKFGMAVADETIETTLGRLGFQLQGKDGRWRALIPSFRSADVQRPIDLVEEFIRLFGVDRLPMEAPTVKALSRSDDPVAVFCHKTALLLQAKGFHECFSYSLTSGERVAEDFGSALADQLSLENPLNADQSHLKATTLAGLMDILHSNRCNGNDMDAAFEIGRVWRTDGAGTIMEAISVAWIAALSPMRTNWLGNRPSSFYEFKNIGLEIARLANLKLRNDHFHLETGSALWQANHAAQTGNLEKVGFLFTVGNLNLKRCRGLGIEAGVLAGEFLLLPDLLHRRRKAVHFQPFSNYPQVMRDLSFLVDRGLPIEPLRIQLEKSIRAAMTQAVDLTDLWVTDIFRGPDGDGRKKNVSFRFQFGSRDRTLDENEIQSIFTGILAAARNLDGAELRDGT